MNLLYESLYRLKMSWWLLGALIVVRACCGDNVPNRADDLGLSPNTKQVVKTVASAQKASGASNSANQERERALIIGLGDKASPALVEYMKRPLSKEYSSKRFIVMKPTDGAVRQGIAPFEAWEIVVFPDLTRTKLIETARQVDTNSCNYEHSKAPCRQSTMEGQALGVLGATGFLGLSYCVARMPWQVSMSVATGLGLLMLRNGSQILQHNNEHFNAHEYQADTEYIPTGETIKNHMQKALVSVIPATPIIAKFGTDIDGKEIDVAHRELCAHKIVKFALPTIVRPSMLKQYTPFLLTDQQVEEPLYGYVPPELLLNLAVGRMIQKRVNNALQISLDVKDGPKLPLLSPEVRAFVMRSCNLSEDAGKKFDEAPLVLARNLNNAEDLSTVTVLNCLSVHSLSTCKDVVAQKGVSVQQREILQDGPCIIVDGVSAKEFADRMNAALPDRLKEFRRNRVGEEQVQIPKVVQSGGQYMGPLRYYRLGDPVDSNCAVQARSKLRSVIPQTAQMGSWQVPFYTTIEVPRQLGWKDPQPFSKKRWVEPIVPVMMKGPKMGPTGGMNPNQLQQQLMAAAVGAE